MAIFLAQAAFKLVDFSFTGHVFLQVAIGGGHIVRVEAFAPKAVRVGGHFVERVAQHLGPSGIYQGLAGLNVPLPRSHAGAGDDVVQALALYIQHLGCAPFVGDVGADGNVLFDTRVAKKRGNHGVYPVG